MSPSELVSTMGSWCNPHHSYPRPCAKDRGLPGHLRRLPEIVQPSPLCLIKSLKFSLTRFHGIHKTRIDALWKNLSESYLEHQLHNSVSIIYAVLEADVWFH